MTDVRQLLTPRDPEFAAALGNAYASHEFLRQTFPDPDSEALLKWVAINGVLDAPDVFGRFFPPVPPEGLRHTSCGGPTEHTHQLTSVEDFLRLAELWEIYSDTPFSEIGSVLDFGCGCGRVIKWFEAHLGGERCTGTDVRKASVDWCNASLGGHYIHHEPRPPFPGIADDSFNLIYSLSVFSHLNLEANLGWIEELARVCRPDGLILASTHGAFTFGLIARDPDKQADFHMSKGEAIAHLRALQATPFVLHRPPNSWNEPLDGPEEDYGQTFFTEAFVHDQWSPYVELVGYIPASLNMVQDFFILRPRK